MKLESSLICLLGSIAFLFDTTAASACEADLSQSVVFTAPWEIQERVGEMKGQIYTAIETILSIPLEGQVSDRVMKSWDELCGQLCKNVEALNTISVSEPMLQWLISESLDDFQLFALESIQNVDLVTPESTRLSEALMVIWIENVLSTDVGMVCVADENTLVQFEEDKNDSHVLISPRRMKLVNQPLLAAVSKEQLFASLERSRAFLRYPLLVDQAGRLKIVLIRSDRSSEDRAGGRIEGRVGASWGGSQGVEFDVGVKAEVRDGQGNYVEANVSQNDKGEGRATLSGGYEKEEND